MTTSDGRWTLVYNGEVYNHLDLRKRYCADWQFRGHSDTESVLALLACKGPGILGEMVGMWAMLLWDEHSNRLLVSRDRYGQKPLYWRRYENGSFGFASEIKPLLIEGESPSANLPAVAEFLATGNYGHLGENTFLNELKCFPPAHWAMLHAGNRTLQTQRYWQLPTVSRKDRRPYDKRARSQFRAAFEEAVQSQLMSDVPVGATLSGGLDSSAIVGMMATIKSGRIPVFTAQTPGTLRDESEFVRSVDKKWKGKLEICWCKCQDIRLSTDLPKTIRTQEEPFGDPSIIAHGTLMDAARTAGVPVILGGQGGDEILHGYPFLGHARLATSLREGRLMWTYRQASQMKLRWNELIRIGLVAAAPRLANDLRMRSRTRRRAWLSTALINAVRDFQADLPCSDLANDKWLEAVQFVALPHLTHYDDRSGMARTIEGRMPFLDHRLADVVCSLDHSAFIGRGLLKHILRDSLGDLLPDSVRDRRDKVGFHTPLEDLLRVEIEWVERVLSDEFTRALGLFNIVHLLTSCKKIRRGLSSALSTIHVWRALVVRLWVEQFNVSVQYP